MTKIQTIADQNTQIHVYNSSGLFNMLGLDQQLNTWGFQQCWGLGSWQSLNYSKKCTVSDVSLMTKV